MGSIASPATWPKVVSFLANDDEVLQSAGAVVGKLEIEMLTGYARYVAEDGR